MKVMALIVTAALSLFARTACAEVRIDEHLFSGDISMLDRIIIDNPLLAIVPSLPAELLPLTAPADGRIVSMFGMRRDPIHGGRRHHDGIDIAQCSGAPVRAAAAGRVVAAGSFGGCGITAVIDHGAGLTTRYCHMARLGVRRGEAVGAGERIGSIGATGRATGPHLHFEVRQDDIPIDPAEHLFY